MGGLVAEAMWWVGCGGYVVGGRVGGLSETGNKAISASIEVEVEWS